MGSFETVYPQYQSEVTDEIIDHAHNDYAEALAEAGLVGRDTDLDLTRDVLCFGVPKS